MKKPDLHPSARIAVIYAIAAGAWILLSDSLLSGIAATPEQLTQMQTYKGLVFIVVTALLLYILLQHELHERDQTERSLHSINEDLEKRIAKRTGELEAMSQALREAERTRTRLVADAAHALRGPITSVNMQLGLLDRAPPEKRQKYLDNLVEEMEYLNEVVSNVLDLSYLEADEADYTLGRVDLNVIVRQVLKRHRLLVEANGLAVEFQPDDDLPPLWANYNQLNNLVTNLVDNAIKYTREGCVTITTTADRQSNVVQLQVRDTGMGIAPKDVPNLFNRFYRGRAAKKANIPGTGLGLGIAKEIVDLYHGQIEVESAVGAGSTFTVRLPLATIDAAEAIKS